MVPQRPEQAAKSDSHLNERSDARLGCFSTVSKDSGARLGWLRTWSLAHYLSSGSWLGCLRTNTQGSGARLGCFSTA